MTEDSPQGQTPGLTIRVMQWLMPRITPAHVWMYRRLRGRIVNRATGGAPVVLLTTVGRRSGKPRTVALGHLRDGDDVIVAGTNGGLRPLPAWVHNLRADPHGEAQVSGDRYPVRAEFLEGEDWDRHWAQLVSAYPIYDQARRFAGRPIPLIRLTRTDG